MGTSTGNTCPEGLHVFSVLKPAYYLAFDYVPKERKDFSIHACASFPPLSKQEPLRRRRWKEAESRCWSLSSHRLLNGTVEPKDANDEVPKKNRVVNVEYVINLKRRAKFGK